MNIVITKARAFRSVNDFIINANKTSQTTLTVGKHFFRQTIIRCTLQTLVSFVSEILYLLITNIVFYVRYKIDGNIIFEVMYIYRGHRLASCGTAIIDKTYWKWTVNVKPARFFFALKATRSADECNYSRSLPMIILERQNYSIVLIFKRRGLSRRSQRH